METVNAFNVELCSLYSTKPPISKTKMVELTKLAMKAAKFYKHVVQSIEKFIHKCQSEFKIPGLYVIDSIVRQSRHQFGTDKDAFSQRFSKNIALTFHNLLTCPAQDICKITRVLNLWQKNSVFPPTIIQPLLDMAADPSNTAVYLNAQKSIQRVTGMMPSVPQSASGSASTSRANARSSSGPVMDSDVGTSEAQTDVLKAISQLLQQTQQPAPVVPLLNPQQLQLHLIQQQLLQQLQAQQQPEPPLSIDGNLMAQIQALTAALVSRLGGGGGGGGAGAGEGSLASEEFVSTMEASPVINKKFVDVSCTESDLDDDRRDVQSLPMEHGHNQRHQRLTSDLSLDTLGHSSKLWSPEDASHTFDHDMDRSHDDISDVATPRSCQPRPPTAGSGDCFVSPFVSSLQQLQSTPCEDELPSARKVDRRSHLEREQKKDDAWNANSGKNDERSILSLKQPPEEHQIRKNSVEIHENAGREHSHDIVHQDLPVTRPDRKRRRHDSVRSHEQESSDFKDSRVLKMTSKDQSSSRDIYQSTGIEAEEKMTRRRSRSRSRSRNSHRSRSRSHSRTISREKKHRPQSPDHNHSWRHVEHEQPVSSWPANEHQRSRLVPSQEQHVSIISLTVWIGNVSKQVKEELLRAEVLRFGRASINFVPHRGCAFACFETRQEAERAIEGLNNIKLVEKSLKVTWAPNLGIKESEFRSCWDVDLGVTYIPWDRLPPNLDDFVVGAIVDEESLPEQMKSSSKNAAGFRDDQMTSNEVTSSTDCQQDGLSLGQVPVMGQVPVTLSNATLSNNNSLPSVVPAPLVTLASNISSGEKSKEVATPLSLYEAETLPKSVSSVPSTTEKDTSLKLSVEPKVSRELSLMPEISLSCSQFVQGIQNILNSANASSVTSSQSVPGIIAPGVSTSASPADALFTPLPGVWPSLCGFNPLVPPPSFLPSFDPTRPPPSFGQPPATNEPAAPLTEKKQEESNSGIVEDTSENMDLDDSVSSSQGDDQDFLESQIELVRSGPVSAGLQLVESRNKAANANCWKSTCGETGYAGQRLVDGFADSGWNSSNSISSVAVPSSDVTGLSCAVSKNTLMPSGSDGVGVNSFYQNDGSRTAPPFMHPSVSRENSQNPSCLSGKPANLSIMRGLVLDGPNDGALKAENGYNGPRNPDLTLHSNLGPIVSGTLSNMQSRDSTVPCADKPNQCLSMAHRIPFQGQSIRLHGPSSTATSSGNRECVSFDSERPVLGSSAGMLIGAGLHSQSDITTEGISLIHGLQGMSKGISSQLSEMKPATVPFHLSGATNQGLVEMAGTRNVPLCLPGNQNQMPCGPSGSYGISNAQNQILPGMHGNNRPPDGCSHLSLRPDGSRQLPGGSQGSLLGFSGPDGHPQTAGRQNMLFRMLGDSEGQLRMPGGQMQIIGDTNGQNRMPLGSEVRPFVGPDGLNQMSGGHIRMPFCSNGMQVGGPNQISDGPHAMQGKSFGCQSSNQMPIDGKEGGFGGFLEVHRGPVHLPGMPVGSVRMPGGLDVMCVRQPQIDGPNPIPNVPGMQRGSIQISAQMPRICGRGMDIAVGPNRITIPNQIPSTNQMPGSHGMPVPIQMTGSNQLRGQVQMSGGAAGSLVASSDSSIERDGSRPGQPPFLGMFPSGAGAAPSGVGGMNVRSTGSFSGYGLQFPMGIARMASSNSGGSVYANQCGLPFGPNRMPSLDGMIREIKEGVSQSHERISVFGAMSSGSGVMPAGNRERFFGPNGVPPPSVEGMPPNQRNAPMGLNRLAFVPSNVSDSPAVGRNRPSFGPLMMSSSSFGGGGATSGPGPVFPSPMESMEQLNCNRDQQFSLNRNMEMGLKHHALPGLPSSDFPHQGFSSNHPSKNSDSHSFSSRTGSGGYDQLLISNQKLSCGILENAEKLPMGNQQCLPSSGMGFQGLLGLGNNSVDGKSLTEQAGLHGIDKKMTVIPSLFSNLDRINLLPGQQAFVAKDQFFLKPQLENLQQIEGRRWNADDDDDDGRPTSRHIRRSDLFPSLRQRGRHQHSSHHWHDRRHDRRDRASREFKDRADCSQDYCDRSISRDGRVNNRSMRECAANAPGKNHQMFDIKSEIESGVKSDVKPELTPGFRKSDFMSGVKSERKPDVKSELYDQKTVAEAGNQCAEEKKEAANLPDSAVSADEKDCL